MERLYEQQRDVRGACLLSYVASHSPLPPTLTVGTEDAWTQDVRGGAKLTAHSTK